MIMIVAYREGKQNRARNPLDVMWRLSKGFAGLAVATLYYIMFRLVQIYGARASRAPSGVRLSPG